MAGITLRSVRGTEGEVTVPSLGLLIATTYKWSLTRREEYGPNQGAFTLRAAFSYSNPLFKTYWEEDGMRKLVVVKVGRRGPAYRVETTNTTKATIEEHQLTLEGVQIWPVEEQRQQ